MNHTDAIGKGILGGTDQRLLAIDENPALIGKIDAGEHIHERCLAAAVFPQQSQNFALVDIQPHPVIGQHRAKPFGNVPHLHSGFLFFQKDHSFSEMPSPGGRWPAAGGSDEGRAEEPIRRNLWQFRSGKQLGSGLGRFYIGSACRPSSVSAFRRASFPQGKPFSY